jgi:hypothetical protein
MIERLGDLRKPPVAGAYYLVPTVDYLYFGRRSAWPVLGPKHTDVEIFNFPAAHYHVDARFLSLNQVRFLKSRAMVDDINFVVGRSPLNYRGLELPKGRPKLRVRKCRPPETAYLFSDQAPVQELRRLFGEPEAIRLDDGRLLCPHRRAEITTLIRDAEGFVTCPLHGLRVNCGQRVAA